ncbi:hypothetical protein EIP91_010646, partial [Steccherinum ochraceum]
SAVTGRAKPSTSSSKSEQEKDRGVKERDGEAADEDEVIPVSNSFDGDANDDSEEEKTLLVAAGYGEGADDGRELLSAGWGNGHDGAGMEILSAEFVKRGFAHSHSRQSRAQRMAEYAARRSALGCGPILTPTATSTSTGAIPASPSTPSTPSISSSTRSRKRRRLDPELIVDPETENVRPTMKTAVQQDAEDEDMCAGYTITFRAGPSGFEPAFQYTPAELRSVLFPECSGSETHSRKRKRSPLQQKSSSSSPTRTQQRDVLVETACERFWIAPEEDAPSSGGEDVPMDVEGKEQRYLVALVPRRRDRVVVDGAAEGKSLSGPKTTRGAEQEKEKVGISASVVAAEEKGAGEGDKPVSLGGEDVQMAAPESAEGSKEKETGEKSEASKPSGSKASEESKTGDEMAVDSTETGEEKTDRPAEPSSVPLKDAPPPPPPTANKPALTSPTSPPPNSSPPVQIQILHRNLTSSNFDFTKDGLSILENAETGTGTEGAQRKGWRMEARTWRWCTQRESDAWRASIGGGEEVDGAAAVS